MSATNSDAEAELSFADVSALLRVDPSNGYLIWRERDNRNFNARFAGRVAGCLRSDGYVEVHLTCSGVSRLFLAHRLVWMLHHREWPVGEVDHRDHNRSNNRIGNLRIATGAQNRTAKGRPWGEVRYKGVTRRAEGSYRARVKLDGKERSLGSFPTPEDAARAYDDAALLQHGEFAVTNASLGLI